MISNTDKYLYTPRYRVGMTEKRERINIDEARITCYECLGMLDYEQDLTWIVKKEEIDSFVTNHKKLHGHNVTKEVWA